MVIFLVSDITWSFGAVFVCCELCKRAVDACADIGNDFSTLDWYLYPIGIQKILLQIETNIHKLPEFQCFGNIICEREAVKQASILEKIALYSPNKCSNLPQVLNKGFSFYMVLRQFGKE